MQIYVSFMSRTVTIFVKFKRFTYGCLAWTDDFAESVASCVRIAVKAITKNEID